MEKRRKWMVILLLLFGLLPHIDAAEKKRVALTFDDGPCAKSTAYLLQGLRDRGVHATFFLSGYRIDSDPEDALQIASEGHEIGIHGQTHAYFRGMGRERLEGEILSVGDKIEALTGETPKLARPPGGLMDDQVKQFCKDNDLALILWSVDPEDWDPKKRAQTASSVVSQAKDGDIILLHDLTTANADQAFAIIDRLKVAGYEFCTVSELAESCGKELCCGESYFKF